MELKGSRTEANLMSAFVGESQAAVKYWIFEESAKEDGYEEIANVFKITSENEKAHAKQWFKFLHEGIQPTQTNLEDAIKGEHFEHTEMYANFAKQAYEEGFDVIAKMFEMVGKIEAHHEEKYNKHLSEMKSKQVFKKTNAIDWHCRYCGNVVNGTNAPEICPVCKNKQAYFEVYKS